MLPIVACYVKVPRYKKNDLINNTGPDICVIFEIQSIFQGECNISDNWQKAK